jgi:soluble lytic murein transglycosylase-like protein
MRSFGLLFLAITGCVFAGESVILKSGSTLHIDRHEADGGKIRLYTGAGFIEMDAVTISSFEADEVIPTVPVAPPPVAVVTPPPTPAPSPANMTPQELADAAADKYNLPRKLVRSLMGAESAFQSKAVSPKGAIGLMQLMPATAQTLGADPNDPVQNVDAGTRYLRDLLVKYDGQLWHALAAYNAGPGAVEKYRGIPPYQETIKYIYRIHDAYTKP